MLPSTPLNRSEAGHVFKPGHGPRLHGLWLRWLPLACTGHTSCGFCREVIHALRFSEAAIPLPAGWSIPIDRSILIEAQFCTFSSSHLDGSMPSIHTSPTRAKQEEQVKYLPNPFLGWRTLSDRNRRYAPVTPRHTPSTGGRYRRLTGGRARCRLPGQTHPACEDIMYEAAIHCET